MVGFSVFIRVRNQAIDTGFIAVLVRFIAIGVDGFSKCFLEQPVGLDNPQIAVLDRDVTGDFIKKRVILLLQPFYLVDVRGHFYDGNHVAGFVPDGGSIDNDCDLVAPLEFDDLLAAMLPAIKKCFLHGADRTFLGSAFVGLITLLAYAVPEIIDKMLVGIDNIKIPVLYGDKTGH
jgi:hypothetical protein